MHKERHHVPWWYFVTHRVPTFLEDLPGPIYPSDLWLLLFNISSNLLGNMR